MATKKNKYVATNWSENKEQSQSSTQQSTQTQKMLNDALVATIMSGLTGQMTSEQIAAYAKNLLDPQLKAGIEASQQQYETTKLAKEQEIENLIASTAQSIAQQEAANAKSKAGLETAALARGMGRSSYTLQTLANQDNVLAEAVRQLTTDAGRQQSQIQQQITQAAQQNAQTQGRLNTDFAAQMAAKIEELRREQTNQRNQNYMTAVSAAIGSKSDTSSTTSSSGSSLTVDGKVKNPTEYTSSGKTSSGVSKPTGVVVGQKV